MAPGSIGQRLPGQDRERHDEAELEAEVGELREPHAPPAATAGPGVDRERRLAADHPVPGTQRLARVGGDEAEGEVALPQDRRGVDGDEPLRVHRRAEDLQIDRRVRELLGLGTGGEAGQGREAATAWTKPRRGRTNMNTSGETGARTSGSTEQLLLRLSQRARVRDADLPSRDRRLFITASGSQSKSYPPRRACNPRKTWPQERRSFRWRRTFARRVRWDRTRSCAWPPRPVRGASTSVVAAISRCSRRW